jgi:hypothetical protein
LAAIEVEFSEIKPKIEYDRVVGMIEQLKSLGKFLKSRPIGVIEPSGWTSKTTEFSRAYIVRKEPTCSAGKSDCGIKNFTVFYWLRFTGKIESKRTERFELKGFVKRIRYYLVVSGRDVEVSGLDYRQVRKGHFIGVETTLGNDLARVDR